MDSIFYLLRMIFRRQAQLAPWITFDKDGVTIGFSSSDSERFRWDEVERIAGLKKDLVTAEEIFLVFEFGGTPPRTVEISEEWTGFEQLLVPLGVHFGVGRDRYFSLLRPVFDTTPRTLFSRAQAGGVR
jgi:hypothetical protein